MFDILTQPTLRSNTAEFMLYTSKMASRCHVVQEIKERSRLTQEEWVEYTKQIWDIIYKQI